MHGLEVKFLCFKYKIFCYAPSPGLKLPRSAQELRYHTLQLWFLTLQLVHFALWYRIAHRQLDLKHFCHD